MGAGENVFLANGDVVLVVGSVGAMFLFFFCDCFVMCLFYSDGSKWVRLEKKEGNDNVNKRFFFCRLV